MVSHLSIYSHNHTPTAAMQEQRLASAKSVTKAMWCSKTTRAKENKCKVVATISFIQSRFGFSAVFFFASFASVSASVCQPVDRLRITLLLFFKHVSCWNFSCSCYFWTDDKNKRICVHTYRGKSTKALSQTTGDCQTCAGDSLRLLTQRVILCETCTDGLISQIQ